MPFEIDSTCSNSCERKHFSDLKPGTHLKLLKLICDVPRSFRNLTANLRPQRSLPYLDLFLVLSLVLLAVLSPVMASSLSLVAPEEVDVSGQGSYKMVFVPSTDASDLSALFQIPEGFSYAGNSSIILDGKSSSCEPTQSGQSLRWDLGCCTEILPERRDKRMGAEPCRHRHRKRVG